MFASMSSGDFPADRPVELVVLPIDQRWLASLGGPTSGRGTRWMHTFIDAHNGDVVINTTTARCSLRWASVPASSGIARRSVPLRPGGSWAVDGLRPPLLVTYDLKANPRER